MNQHLQNILDLIQQDESLLADEKKTIMQSLKDADKEMEISAFKLERTEKVKRTTAILLEETIEELEQKRKAVEAQNRELEIESSLERIRTVAMSMNKPDDMLDVCRIISEQLELLNVKDIRNVQTAIINEAKGIYLNYEYFSQYKRTSILEIVTKLHPTVTEFASEMMRSKDAFFTKIFEGKELQDWREYRKKTNQDPDPILDKAESVHYYFYSIGTGALGVSAYAPLSEDEISLFKRFRNVFDLAYRRFLDIEKAIAQAKEAQIETSLERVRAQAMAMRTPEELTGICEVLYKELNSLGFTEIRNAMINIHDDEKETFVNYDYSDEIGKSINHLHYNIHPLIEKQMKEIRNAEGFSETSYTGKDLEDMITFRKKIGEKDDPRIEQAEALYYYFYSIGTGSIGISTFNIIAGEKLDVLKRFRNVFTLAYQRYTDIAQAEAQAREAEIELALERVRARTMAMQRSDELVDVATVLFQQVKALGVPQWNCGFNIWNMGDDEFTYYPGSPDGIISPSPCKISLTEHPVFMRFDESRKRGDELLIYEKEGEEQADHYRYMLSLPGVGDLLQSMLDAGFELPKFQIDHLANFAYGNLIFITYEHFPEMHEVFKRFAKVFEQTYTRFLDLQKAEAQAREAQIEAALERVRSRTMGMQQSSELGEVAAELFHQMNLLVANLWTCGFVLCEKDRDEDEWWLSMDSGFTRGFFLPNIGDYTHAKLYEGWIKEESFRTVQLEGDDLEEHYRWLMNLPVAKSIFEEMDDAGLERPDWQKLHAAYFSKGYLVLITREPCGEEEIFKRFAQVFDQTYTRFLDLQKAEAQTREAQIELGLERVRARAMAMQKSEELSELVDTVFKELTKLDFALNWCIINIIDAPSLTNMVWAANPETNKPPESYLMKFEDFPFHHSMLKGYQERKTKHVYVLEGKEKNTYDDYLFNKTEWSRVPKAAQAASRAMKRYVATFTFSNFGGLQTVGEEYLSEENLDILSRFGKVFDLTYTRFNDLQKAEAQAKEAQIELALERVRARTMAMQHSEELQDTSLVLFEQLKELGEPAEQCTIGIIKESEGVVEISATLHGNKMQQTFKHKIDEPFVMNKMFRGWKDQQKTLVLEIKEEELKKYNQYRNELVGKETFPVKLLPGDRRLIHIAYFSKGMMALSTNEPRPAESLQLLERFAIVFEQTYTRFLDLQKAEAQAKEAQIEAALERVRSRSMGMQKSEELKEVIKIVYRQLRHLKINLDHAGFVVDYTPGGDWHFWIADEQDIPAKITHPYFESVWADQFNEAKQKGADIFATCLNFEEKNKFYNELLSYVPGLPETSRDYYLNCPGLAASTVLLDNVALYIENFSGIPYTEEENNTLMRFGKVFQQTYTRFLDLQKAEAQAREAHIEASLERVRASAMAMHQSAELTHVLSVLFEQFDVLGICPVYSQMSLLDLDTNTFVFRCTGKLGKRVMAQQIVAIDTLDIIKETVEKWKKSEPRSINELYFPKEIIPGLFEIFKEIRLATPADALPNIEDFPNGLYVTEGNCQFGYMGFAHSRKATAEEKDIVLKFATEFGRLYQRFLDLQKAEAQAREAKIEAALERTRTQSMIMQHSNELDDTLRVFHQQVLLLGIPSAFSFLWLPDEEKEQHKFWAAWAINNSTNFSSKAINYPLDRNEPATAQCLIDWKSTKPVYSYHVPPTGVENYFDVWSELITGVEQLKPEYFSEGLYYVEAFMKYGCFGVIVKHELKEEEKKILARVAIEFERTYTRFLDLQKSEFQTHQAKIETALEKVRARALAMQQPEELAEVAQVMRYEMGLLGVEELETSSIYIHEEASENAECWYAIKDIRVPEKKLVADHFKLNLHDTWVGRQMFEFYHSKEKQISIPMQGANRKEWINYCSQQSKLLDGFYGEVIPDRTYHFYKFSNGTIGAATPGSISNESWDLLQRAASVFSLAYSRFKDLTQARIDLQKLKEEKTRAEDALTELQVTQKQLIQSEKMASLGELTAGIAHEIQNPLNFVNNFSEVSNELIDEMNAEIEKGDMEEAKAIANDIKQNLEKINHHGKRADAIVKGMLQHSRSSTATKEPADINKLADEYLRLAYHGLRAKDKSFNATMKTDFDESIGNINIIPQDIGRVILNLITNAFYAAPLPQPAGGGFSDPEYKHSPTVWVSTKRIDTPSGDGGKVLISVRDNGPGIPQKILDKIFQPFFTTKPTGQGTGLGLSLSYDIVKAHGGEIKVITKENEGTEFIIQLPIN